MPFYSFEMVLVGVILLSAMAFGGVKLWLNRRAKDAEPSDLTFDTTQDNPP